MAKRVACEKCGNMVASTSNLCPYCRDDPNKWRRRGSILVGILIVAYIADLFLADGATVRTILSLTH